MPIKTIKKKIDKDLNLFLDIVKELKANIVLEKIRLIKNEYPIEYINKIIYFYKIKINNLIKRLQKRLNIISIDKFLILY